MPDLNAERLPPESLFVLGGISQYVGAAIAVELFDDLSPQNVAFMRVVGAALIVVLFRRSWRREWSKQALAATALFGIVLAAMNVMFYLAIDLLPLGNAVAIEFLGPISVAALGARSTRGITALILAGGGVAAIAGIQPEGSLVGVVFALIAALLWAGYIILGHRVALSGFGVDGLGFGMAVGAIVIAPATVGGLTIDRPALLLFALATGLFSNAIPYGIDQLVMVRLTRARFALLQSLLPVIAVAIGFIVLGQRLRLLEVVGVVLVAVAIWLGSSQTELDVASSGVGA